MLIKVYYSSFSAFAASTFDWLIDGRSLVKTKSKNLINSVCFRVRSITKTAKYWRETRKLQCESTQWKVQYMVHEIWKIQYQFADAKIDWLLCQSLFFNNSCNFIWKESLAQVFSCGRLLLFLFFLKDE